MRTDVKIGIAVGLLLVVGTVVYMVVSPGSDPPDEDPTIADPVGPTDPGAPGAGGLDSNNTGGGLDNSLFGPQPVDPWDAGSGDSSTTGDGNTSGGGSDLVVGVGPGDTSGGGTDLIDPGPIDPGPAVADPGSGGEDVVIVSPGPVDPGPIGVGPVSPPWDPADDTSSVGPVDPGSPTDVPYPADPGDGSTSGVVVGVVAGAGRTHVIKSSDLLWNLAETYYGHGKHWPVLLAANPGLSPTKMPIGKTIRIPPLPVEIRSPGAITPAAGPTGTVVQGADGTKTYIVAKDDSFWKIAARSDVYGNGIHYKLIAEANPNADSSRLQPGDKLVIPPLATASSGAGGVTSGAVTPDPISAVGEKVYVVKESDRTGMWGISQSQLGHGKYSTAIAARNSNVDPSRMRIGQKIIIPSLEQAKAFLTGSSRPSTGAVVPIGPSSPAPTRPTRPTRVPVPDDEPDFG